MHPWRARLDRWFGVLASRCPFSPNQLTVLAMVISLLAAGFLAGGSRRPVFFLVAPLLVTVAGLLDAFDGIVARHRGLTSRFGDFLDHFCDRVSDLSILGGWILGAGIRPSLGLSLMVVVMLSGYAGTQIEATWGERRYEGLGRGEYVLALVALPLIAYSLASAGVLHTRFGGLSVPEWLSIAVGVAALMTLTSRFMRAVEMAQRKDPE